MEDDSGRKRGVKGKDRTLGKCRKAMGEKECPSESP